MKLHLRFVRLVCKQLWLSNDQSIESVKARKWMHFRKFFFFFYFAVSIKWPLMLKWTIFFFFSSVLLLVVVLQLRPLLLFVSFRFSFSIRNNWREKKTIQLLRRRWTTKAWIMDNAYRTLFLAFIHSPSRSRSLTSSYA